MDDYSITNRVEQNQHHMLARVCANLAALVAAEPIVHLRLMCTYCLPVDRLQLQSLKHFQDLIAFSPSADTTDCLDGHAYCWCTR